MKLEAVGRVSVRNLGLQICGQIDDVNGSKWAFLWTDAAADT